MFDRPDARHIPGLRERLRRRAARPRLLGLARALVHDEDLRLLTEEECDFAEAVMLAPLGNHARSLLRTGAITTHAQLRAAVDAGEFERRSVGRVARRQLNALAKTCGGELTTRRNDP